MLDQSDEQKPIEKQVATQHALLEAEARLTTLIDEIGLQCQEATQDNVDNLFQDTSYYEELKTGDAKRADELVSALLNLIYESEGQERKIHNLADVRFKHVRNFQSPLLDDLLQKVCSGEWKPEQENKQSEIFMARCCEMRGDRLRRLVMYRQIPAGEDEKQYLSEAEKEINLAIAYFKGHAMSDDLERSQYSIAQVFGTRGDWENKIRALEESAETSIDPLRTIIALDEACGARLNTGENQLDVLTRLLKIRDDLLRYIESCPPEHPNYGLAMQRRMSNIRHIFLAAAKTEDNKKALHWAHALNDDPVFNDPNRVDPKIKAQYVQEMTDKLQSLGVADLPDFDNQAV